MKEGGGDVPTFAPITGTLEAGQSWSGLAGEEGWGSGKQRKHAVSLGIKQRVREQEMED